MLRCEKDPPADDGHIFRMLMVPVILALVQMDTHWGSLCGVLHYRKHHRLVGWLPGKTA